MIPLKSPAAQLACFLLAATLIIMLLTIFGPGGSSKEPTIVLVKLVLVFSALYAFLAVVARKTLFK
jgi:hypothetical protein